MIFFNNQSLFDSGPAKLHIGGLSLRHANQPASELLGTQMVGQGVQARSITQVGSLISDDQTQLRSLIIAIEGCVDGKASLLKDSEGIDWPDVVILDFNPQEIVAAGPRSRCDYTIDYLQVKP